MKISFPAFATLALLLLPQLSLAQGACGRALMMAGADINGPAELAQKRVLELQCAQERGEDQNRQQLAQKRIEARSSWAAVKPAIRACIDGKLEVDGRTVDQLIALGIAASDESISPYRRECFGVPLEAQSKFTPPAPTPPPTPAPAPTPQRSAQSDFLRGEDGGEDPRAGNSRGGQNNGLMQQPGPGSTSNTIILNGGGSAGTGDIIVVMPKGGRTSSSVNLLEAAINPLTGTRRLWESFKDEGGLETLNNFYGVTVTKLTVTLDNERVQSARLQISSAVSPRKLREALGEACRGDERDWRIDNDRRGARGELRTGALTCRYEANDTTSDYSVSLVRQK